MKFYFGLLMMLGGYCLFYWGVSNVIHWPGVDSGQTTAPPMSTLFGFNANPDIPHKIPFGVKSAVSGTGSVSVDPSYQQKMDALAQGKKSVSGINPLGNAGYSTGSPIPSGVDVQGGNYKIPGT